MGTVYEAIQEGLGRRVAVKMLDPRLAEDRQQLERFRREAEVVASLGHPNIVQVTDFQYPNTQEAQAFLVMELLRGESLGGRLTRESVLRGARVAFIAAQVLSALHAAHRAGIVHRDVKPDNIFLLADAAVPDTVKVLDFGIAKLAVEGQAKLTGTGAMLGTPAFMAPEQARGADDVDARADVYAVGATMYQALSGKLPHEEPSIPALLFAIVEKTPAPLHELRPDLPSGLVEVVERAMSKDRTARFPDAESMRRALAPWSGLPASIPPPVSATALTIASDPLGPRDQATPIVVHRTPSSSLSQAPTEAMPPPSVMLSKRNRNRTVIILAVLGVVMCFKIISYLEERDRREERLSHHEDSRGQSVAREATSLGLAAAAKAIGVAPPPSSVTSEPNATAIAVGTLDSGAPTASVVAPPHRYSGTLAFLSSTDFGDCHGCDWDGWKADIRARESAIVLCFKASEHTPPLHQSVMYEIGVTKEGAYTSFDPMGDSSSAPKSLHQCLRNVVFGVTLHKPTGEAGSFKVGFRGECPGRDLLTQPWCP